MFKPKGPRPLASIVSAFEGQITELDQRIELDENEKHRNDDEIKALEAKNTDLSSDVTRASRIRDNIKELIAL